MWTSFLAEPPPGWYGGMELLATASPMTKEVTDIEEALNEFEKEMPMMGQRLIRKVHNAYTLYFYHSNGRVWENTLLSSTYDYTLRGNVIVPPCYTRVPSIKRHDPVNVSILKS